MSPGTGCSSWCSGINVRVRLPFSPGPGGRIPARTRSPADTEDVIVRLRKELSKQGLDAGAETIAAHLARQTPGDGGRLVVPAVSTIWRILSRRGFVSPATAETAAVVVAHVLR